MLNQYLVETVVAAEVAAFQQRSTQKIATEVWDGRNQTVKAGNFAQAWITEYAWHRQLDRRNIKHHWASTYVGPREGAPLDFQVWSSGHPETIGIRSRTLGELERWVEVPYPDDRFRGEHEWMEDWLIASAVQEVPTGREVRFYGVVSRDRLLKVLTMIQRRHSPKNQEMFRPVPLGEFSFERMLGLLARCDRTP